MQRSFPDNIAETRAEQPISFGSGHDEPVVSLEAGMQILHAFTADRASLTEAEIAAEVALPSRQCAAALETLCRYGILQNDGHRYTCGVRALELGTACQHQLPLVQIADRIMRTIRDELDETTMIAVRSGDYRVNVAQAESRHPLRQSIPLGKPKPLYIGAGGKTLLSGLSDTEIEAYLNRVPLERMSPTTTTDRQALLNAVRHIRQTGFAETFSERNHGGASFAAPIKCGKGEIVGALVVSMPLYRFGPEMRDSIVQFLVSGADEISELYRKWGSRPRTH